jgi:hypothetical protein
MDQAPTAGSTHSAPHRWITIALLIAYALLVMLALFAGYFFPGDSPTDGGVDAADTQATALVVVGAPWTVLLPASLPVWPLYLVSICLNVLLIWLVTRFVRRIASRANGA